jgi:hypothetical protein
MADLKNIRSRPGVRIQLHPSDIVSIMLQQDVLQEFTEGEILDMLEMLHAEINYRQNGRKKNADTNA